MKSKFTVTIASMALVAGLSAPGAAQESGETTGELDLIQSVPSLSAKGTGGLPGLGLPDWRTFDPFKQGDVEIAQVEGFELATGLEDSASGNVFKPMDFEPTYRNIDPFYRNIDPFWRDINPFYRNIDPFWRDINPFYRDIIAFWGAVNPYAATFSAFGGTAPAYDQVGQYWRDTGYFWTTTEAKWAALGTYSSNQAGYTEMQGLLNELVTRSATLWGPAVQNQTGQNFMDGFALAVFARHGIDLNNMSTFENKSAGDRARFFLDWYDSLMSYTGVDHIDHWMGSVNWTPQLTQIQGSGADSIIGLLDTTVVNDADLANNIIFNGGTIDSLGGHGTGVVSLMIAAHDGQGVMGIAPNARVVAYNPFQADGTATVDRLAQGIQALRQNGASVINMSLGVPGSMLAQDHANLFADPRVTATTANTVFVLAAGNDGAIQTANVSWKTATLPAFIVVGSVDPSGQISTFSNQPGNACLILSGGCNEANRLFMRTIVAPGELMLVSDGNGGLVRRSGTSFAAPLVSGAITLLHDRWPWLANYPHETVDIILRSARDLGAPGADQVYGRGMLDVRASQSPLDFGKLTYTMYSGSSTTGTSRKVSNLLSGGVVSTWQTNSVYFTMFEPIGRTHRDFVVPMSTLLYGQQRLTNGTLNYFQSHVSGRFAEWLRSGGTDRNGDGLAGFSDIRSGNELSGEWQLNLSAMRPNHREDGSLDPVHMAMTLTDPSGQLSLSAGHGQGALALTGGRMQIMGDHDRFTGGNNPVLGFASGETFASVGYAPFAGSKVTFGFSENRADWDELEGIALVDQESLRSLESHEASAFTLDYNQQVTGNVSVNLQYTRLDEEEALLGTQSTADGLLGRGTVTDAMTLSAAVDLGEGFSFDLSATGARSGTAGDQALATPDGVWSSAGQVAVGKRGVIGDNDRLRLSVAQPLTVEAGTVEFHGFEVVDRSTGEIGVVTQQFSIEGRRRVVGEALYATPIGDAGEFGLFGRYESQGNPGETENYVFGGTMNLRF